MRHCSTCICLKPEPESNITWIELLLIQDHIERGLKKRGCMFRHWVPLGGGQFGVELQFKTASGREYLLFLRGGPARSVTFTLRNLACTVVIAGGAVLSIDDPAIQKTLDAYLDLV